MPFVDANRLDFRSQRGEMRVPLKEAAFDDSPNEFGSNKSLDRLRGVRAYWLRSYRANRFNRYDAPSSRLDIVRVVEIDGGWKFRVDPGFSGGDIGGSFGDARVLTALEPHLAVLRGPDQLETLLTHHVFTPGVGQISLGPQ